MTLGRTPGNLRPSSSPRWQRVHDARTIALHTLALSRSLTMLPGASFLSNSRGEHAGTY